MTWNYRIVRTVIPSTRPGEEPYVRFGLHEVHYNARGEPCGWSRDPRPLEAETLEEMHETFVRACAALGAGVVDHRTKLGKPDFVLDEEEKKRRAAERAAKKAARGTTGKAKRKAPTKAPVRGSRGT